ADKTRAGDDWESWRWDYATAAACSHRKKDDLQTVNKIIDDTPQKLRGFVRITLASNCEATTPAETLDLLASARKDLEKVDPSQQAHWYLALMRVYAKVSPEAALEVLSQTIAAINDTSKERQIDCKTTASNPPVLSTWQLQRDYEIPTTLLETDEGGVLNAIKSVQPADIRAALRLQLLTMILDQQQKTDKGLH
ncbi:MAG TPA: hypothetical protein VJ875_24750, partial [Pyrinomonadaceae bacterium]|nr:hypothetical protein [Pyrinomonadaceae bacterium]